ncbi:MAG: insulinase family protein [Holosporales bacterium]|jgi:predicted Zn-dependent peptidase|nr:insulinase family protein [Holosporales bacterium]
MDITITRLENGLAVVTDKMAGNQIISLGMFVNIGSVNENDEQAGASHFLEHMAFKGTKIRTAFQIAKEMEEVGGIINAYTDKEVTAYYARILKRDVRLAVSVISDMIQHSIMDAKEFAKEQDVVVQEIKMIDDMPDAIIFEKFQEKCYDGSKLGKPILGTEDSIHAMKPNDLRKYMAKYTADKIVLAASGDIEHSEIVALANEYVGGVKAISTDNDVEVQRYSGGYACIERALGQSHVVMGFEGVGYNDPCNYAVRVVKVIFGDGMSSRLFQEIREKRGLAYSIGAFRRGYRDTGMFGVRAGCDDRHVTDVIKISLEELNKMKTDITTEELERAKAQIKVAELEGLETSIDRVCYVAGQLLLRHKIVTPLEVIEEIDAITIDAVVESIERITGTNPTLAVIGSGHDIGALYENCK